MAFECVGGAFLSSFLGAVFQQLASPQVLDFFRGTKFDQRLQKDSENKLNEILAVVDDAELKQFGNTQVRDWLLRVKVAMLDMEDVLDEILCQQQHSSTHQLEAESESQTCTCKVPNFFKSSSVSSFNKEINSSMKKVLGDLDDLVSSMISLPLKKATDVGVGSGSGSTVSRKLPSTSLVDESDICGRDDDKEMILNWLTSDTDKKLSILSIVGMGGLGKTTLAQLVYNDPRIEDTFNIKAWVCVSEEFHVLTLSRAILNTFTKSNENSDQLEIVHTKLKEKLSGKRFLLVLDDVWNDSRSNWEAVQNALVCGDQGSRIIVTTRSEKVASTMWSVQHHLHLLQEEYCWQLFAKHAFHEDGNPQPNPDRKKIGMKIVEKCKGLPLALKSMGSLLHNESSDSGWENILKSEIWELKDSDIVPALALSYHHLPSHLKKCFAFCALFPKDYEFDKECLIQLWMAESFLQCHQHSKSAEEVGEQYFNDLLVRCFFQEISNIEGEKFFVMHDLLNDLAKFVCGDICIRFGVDKGNGTSKTTRHFLLGDFVFESLDDAERLHTFISINHWICDISKDQLFSKFKFLRVLSLSHCSNLKEVPDTVSNLKHLRSLDLSHTDIRGLPEWTCSLHNLQTLKLNCCYNLQELPSNLHLLTNLRRLEFIDTKVSVVPAYLGKQKNLQVSMSWFDVGRSKEFSIQHFEGFNLVHGSLSIKNLQNIENPSDALAAGFKNKKNLVELKLKWNSDWKPDDSAKERDAIVIENLEPSKHLKKLSISNYGGKQFPNWLSNNSLSNMVSLKLDNCQSCQHLPLLGHLPFLKNLEISRLDGIVSIGADFHGNSSCSFASLETLEFCEMREWGKWECEAVTGAFPCLQHLSITECPKLKGHLPEQLVPLKKLEIRKCKQLEASAPRTLELAALEDCGKLQLDWATLKKVRIVRRSMSASMLEMFGFGDMIFDNCLEELDIHLFSRVSSDSEIQSLKTFSLDFFPALRTLQISGFLSLQRITQDHPHNHLQVLSIGNCPELESLPGSMHMLLPFLKALTIFRCPRVESFPEGCLPSNLKELSLDNCSAGLMASLRGMALGDNPSLSLETLLIGKLDEECFPDEGLLPLSLTCLRINDSPNLKRLNYKGLSHPSSLKKLYIADCPNLQQLPDEGLPKSISVLTLKYNSPLLKERCQKPGGQDWTKIAHIQNLCII